MNYWDNLMGSDEGAATYMESYGEGPGCRTRLELGSFINDGESVLDVGCGPGWNYDHFQEYGPRISGYLGLDYAERFVRAAKKRHPGHYLLGDIRHIDQPDNSWDVVIFQDVLEHTSGYEQSIAEGLRVAKKRVIATFWHLIEDDTQEHLNIDGNDGFGYWYSRPRWERFLDWTRVTWLHHQFEWPEGRVRDFYILDKQEPR